MDFFQFVQSIYPLDYRQQADLFINWFHEVDGYYPADFHFESKITSIGKNWRHQLTSHVLDSFAATRGFKHKIVLSQQNFYEMSKLCNPETCTFFTPISELGMSPEEMYVVIGLQPGKCPYKEYVLVRRSSMSWSEETRKCTRPFMRFFSISTFVGKYGTRGRGRCHIYCGLGISSLVARLGKG